MLFLRSMLFYIGYVAASIVLSTFLILLFPLLNAGGRKFFVLSWCRSIIYWLRVSCAVDYRVVGLENLRKGPVVILANHQSSWETIFLYLAAYPVAPILKKELLSIPFWGWAMRLQKPIAIDRSKPREAGKSLLKQGTARLDEGISVVVFPEGTRREIGQLRRFSRGAAKLALAAGSDVVLVAHDAGRAWPPGKICKRPCVITVVVSEPVATAEHSADSLTEFAESWIRDRMRLIAESELQSNLGSMVLGKIKEPQSSHSES